MLGEMILAVYNIYIYIVNNDDIQFDHNAYNIFRADCF